MKKIFTLLFLFCSFSFFAQDKIVTKDVKYNLESVHSSAGEYFTSSSKNFIDYQTLFLVKENNELVLMNGEAFGIPQNSSRDVIVFVGDNLSDNHSISLICINHQYEVILKNDSQEKITTILLK